MDYKVIDITPIVCVERNEEEKLEESSAKDNEPFKKYAVKLYIKISNGTNKEIEILVEKAKDKKDAIQQAKRMVREDMKIFLSEVNEIEEIE